MGSVFRVTRVTTPGCCNAYTPMRAIYLGLLICVLAACSRDDPELRRRLLEMGFCNGACVEIVRRAPLGDPIEFRLRGYYLSLRDEQAKHVVILPQG